MEPANPESMIKGGKGVALRGRERFDYSMLVRLFFFLSWMYKTYLINY